MASNTSTLSDAAVALDLNNIRKSLMRMEDSIIFSLIERGQFKMNSAVYEADCAWLRSARRAHLPRYRRSNSHVSNSRLFPAH